jgi:hypothetical protein
MVIHEVKEAFIEKEDNIEPFLNIVRIFIKSTFREIKNKTEITQKQEGISINYRIKTIPLDESKKKKKFIKDLKEYEEIVKKRKERLGELKEILEDLGSDIIDFEDKLDDDLEFVKSEDFHELDNDIEKISPLSIKMKWEYILLEIKKNYTPLSQYL